MYQTKPISEDIKTYENKIVYEDDNCTILYDFWGKFGNAGFLIYNKSSENIYLHLDKCFYINNGFAYNYYKNRVYTRQVSIGYIESAYDRYSSVSLGASTSAELSIIENKTICIPPKATKEITEYEINKELYQNCNMTYRGLVRFNNTMSFNKYDSPYVFSNILVYSIGDSDELHHIKNEFYVSKITNYEAEAITKYVNIMDCVNKESKPTIVFEESGPDKFYIEYR